ncbi:MAG: hypothetical protein AAB037_04995, partial [Chloroflexota bacterium]
YNYHKKIFLNQDIPYGVVVIIKDEGTHTDPVYKPIFQNSSLRGAKSRGNLCIQGDCPQSIVPEYAGCE